jgi:hypothetical protein
MCRELSREKVEFFCEALGSPQPTYTWLDRVELEKVEFFCEALGSPQPTYAWLDRDWSS